MPKSLSTILLKLKKQSILQLMTLPGIVFLLVFSYIPMIGIIIAFEDYSIVEGFFNSPWVGLKHFYSFITDSTFLMALRNTLILSALKIIFAFPAPIILALILNEVPLLKFKKFTQTCSYLPHFLSYVLVATLWIILLDPKGLVNELLQSLGLTNNAIEFWADVNWFWPLAVIVDIWKSIGWSSIIYISAIASVDQETFQAAMIDGAGRIRRIVSIILPSISGTIAVLFILSVSGLFRGNFDQSYLLGNPFNRSSAYILEWYTLDMGLKQLRFSFSTAINLFQSVASLILLLLANRITYKISEKSIF